MRLHFGKSSIKRFIIVFTVLLISLSSTACSQLTYSFFGATEQLPFNQKWIFELKKPFDESAGALELGPHNTVYFLEHDSSSNLRINCVDSKGTKKWSTLLKDYYSEYADIPFKVGLDGSCYVFGRNTSELTAISPKGKKMWSFKIDDDSIEKGIAVTKDGTVVLSPDNLVGKDEPSKPRIIALGKDGKVKWEFNKDSWFLSKPVIAPDNTIYFVGRDGLYALTSNGTQKWHLDIGSGSDVALAVAKDGTIYVCSGGVYAIRPNGTRKWFTKLDGEFGSGNNIALAKNGTIYTASWDTLYALDTKGRIEWKFNDLSGGDTITGPVLVSRNEMIYFSYRISNAEATRLFAINTDGTKEWDCGADIFTSQISISQDGTIYVLDLNNLKAYSSD